MPSPVKGPASCKALAAENAQLHDIAQAAGVELERNFAQMILMDHENQRLWKQLHAKKNPVRQAYNTGKAQLMTSEEMMEILLHDEHKKLMKVLHQGMVVSLKAIKKKLKDLEKAKKAAAKVAGRDCGRGQARSRGRGRGRGDNSDELPVGHGRARDRGRGCGRGKDGDTETDSDNQGDSGCQGDSHSPSESDSGSETSRSCHPSPSPSRFIAVLPPHEIALPPEEMEAQVKPEQSKSDDEGETKISSFNGHR
ncbi:hypothetical protein C8J56DRAFT_902159 [Mycena floridula]|nr:hypothetical protein C8J56DRAFT_902159 [Mycena floridula]